jgi:Spy/CpxP family protein refolding chaperone
MTLSWRGLIVTALVAFAAGLGGVWLGTTIFQRSAPGLHDIVHERLDLTRDQIGRIETLEAAFATRRQALELEMRAANANLAAAIREEHGYGPGVTAAIERFHHAMGELQSETIRHVFAMRDVLTPEQQEVFDSTVVESLTAEER